MFDYNDIMKNYMKKEEEENKIEKKHKKKKLNPKKWRSYFLIMPYLVEHIFKW